jgi:hypothetical protein
MIDEHPSFGRLEAFGAGACVIGAGPVGIATALALAGRGIRTLLLESGGRAARPEAQDLARGENLRPDNHHAPEITVARRLGGASNLWGGRCLPFDPIDFRSRPWLPGLPAWPIGEADLRPFLAQACALMGAGEPVFHAPLPGVGADDAFLCDRLERWNSVQRVQDLHAATLARHEGLLVALGATALGFRYGEGGRIDGIALHLDGPGGGEGRGVLPAPASVILAAGGNESTRLLLAEARRRPGLFGGPEGPLGRFYMGHVNGQVADIVLASGPLHDGLDFFRDPHGSYVRRRLVPSDATQAAHRLANVAFWPVVPPIADPAHRSGPLSAVFLALSLPGPGRRLVAEPIRLKHVGPPPYRRLPHLLNALRAPWSTLSFGPRFLWRNKMARPRLPGLFLPNPARRYGLEYHSEHLPDGGSRLTLGTETDRLGLPRLRFDLRFGAEDAASVLRAHAALEDWLGRNRLGRLHYRAAGEGERAALVLAEAKHGNHQIGTIRMGRSRAEGVVDGECRAFDVPNLHVVSTAVLPTSGQANPTLTAVQLGLRLAARLAGAAAP